jgi:uncharacterized protein YeaO (DUF488 family)
VAARSDQRARGGEIVAEGRGPSTELRKWFGHDQAKWKQFQTRYRKELAEKKDALELLKQKSKERTVTLVDAAQ